MGKIPLEIDEVVRQTVARGRSKEAGDREVLVDLRDGWTLTHTSAGLRDPRRKAPPGISAARALAPSRS